MLLFIHDAALDVLLASPPFPGVDPIHAVISNPLPSLRTQTRHVPNALVDAPKIEELPAGDEAPIVLEGEGAKILEARRWTWFIGPMRTIDV